VALELLKQKLRANPKILVLPEGEDPRTWLAIDFLLSENLVKQIWVLGASEALSKQKKLSKHSHDPRILFGADMVSDLNERTSNFIRQRSIDRGKTIAQSECEALGTKPLYQGAWILGAGFADAGIAGAIASTADVIRAGLSVIGMANGIKTVSSSFAMYRPGLDAKLWLYADCGVLIDPSSEQLVDIAESSLHTWRGLSQDPPVVSFLSFSTKGSAKHPSQEKMANASRLFLEKFPQIESDGEVQFDTAIDSAVAKRKAPASLVGGRTNIFIFPNLDAGNIAYKITQRLGGFHAWGPLLQGLRKPWSDLSRGATGEDILASAIINLAKSSLID
jgi:phosphate acetyltransferase